MSWYNPTNEEAAEEYYSAKVHYVDAARKRHAAKQAEENYRDEQRYMLSVMQSGHSDKINFEKRAEDIRGVIASLSGENAALISVPDMVAHCNRSAEQTGESFRASMKCSQISPADIADKFRCESVEENIHSSNALNLLRNELKRLEQALDEINAQINHLEQMTDELSQQIMICADEQTKWRKIMIASAYDMHHFARYM